MTDPTAQGKGELPKDAWQKKLPDGTWIVCIPSLGNVRWFGQTLEEAKKKAIQGTPLNFKL